jgi:ornithine cyclodeaminase/alanine dehydrogenase-like protein (mu-crystallin family)
MLILNSEQVRTLLPMAKCIDLMETAMLETSKRNVTLPIRWGLQIPTGGMMGMMPGYLGNPACFGLKLVNIFPQNEGTEYSSHIGCMMLFEPEHGVPLAMLDAAEVTAIRTAAASALATKYLAKQDASVLAIIGSGEEALTHLRALPHVRDFKEIRIWGRTPDNAAKLASTVAKEMTVQISVRNTIEEAISGADVVCTVTSASTPILAGRFLEPGMHLNVVGSSIKEKSEIDREAVLRSKYYVDYRPMTLSQAGEFLEALESGSCDESHIVGEIGEVINGQVNARNNDQEITLYRSLGVASQDLIVAHYLYEQAKVQQAGVMVDF